MAPSRVEQKLLQLGLSPSVTQDKGKRLPPAGPVSPRKRITFKLYFPRPPYNGALYHAAFSNGLYNFVGLVLGHHGATIKDLQKTSGCRIEIHDKDGNLNGDHPSAADPTLHALVAGDDKESLEKAVDMLLDVLAPINTDFEPIKVVPNGGAVLEASIHPTKPQPPTLNNSSAITTSTAIKKPTTPVSTSNPHAGSPAGAVWAGRENNPLLNALKSSSLELNNNNNVKSESEPDLNGANNNNNDYNDASGESGSVLPLDSHRSSVSGFSSEDLGTPTSRDTATLLQPFGGLSGYIGNNQMTTTNLTVGGGGGVNHHHHQLQSSGSEMPVPEPEFSLWHPFSAGGLFDELHQTLSPENVARDGSGGTTTLHSQQQHLNDGNGGSVLSAPPFPGVGSWGVQQVTAASPNDQFLGGLTSLSQWN